VQRTYITNKIFKSEQKTMKQSDKKTYVLNATQRQCLKCPTFGPNRLGLCRPQVGISTFSCRIP